MITDETREFAKAWAESQQTKEDSPAMSAVSKAAEVEGSTELKDYADAHKDMDAGVIATPVKEPQVESKEIPAVERPKSFREAFAEARKSGVKIFDWNGKKYTTQLAGEKQAAKPVAKPAGGVAKAEPETQPMQKLEHDTQAAAPAVIDTAPSVKSGGGKGIIDTAGIDSKTLLPKKS